MRAVVVRVAAAALLVAGCGGAEKPPPATTPVVVTGRRGNEKPQGPPLGFPVLATRNTTRVAGADPVADAAAVARAVYPEAHPRAVVLVDKADWQAGISAAELAGTPLRAPILLADGDTLPAASRAALDALAPRGAKTIGGAQVIRVGTRADVGSRKTKDIRDASPAALAAAVDALQVSAARKPSATVLVAPADAPAYAMPAAGWAAKSGNPVLWARRNALPAATSAVIRRHRNAPIYVLGPASAVSDAVVAQLGKLGEVKRIAGADPVKSAIAFARYADNTFGWNVRDPGHGLVFLSTKRPQDAAAAAPLSATGSYGPQLVTTKPGTLPAALQDFLLDIEPGYDKDPVRGVYNHGWLIGDETAVAAAVQARIDTLLEIEPVDTGGN